MITDNLNPSYVKAIMVDYFFEEKQEMRICVYDVDNFKPGAQVEQKLLGTVDFLLAQVASARGGVLTLPIKWYLLYLIIA